MPPPSKLDTTTAATDFIQQGLGATKLTSWFRKLLSNPANGKIAFVPQRSGLRQGARRT
ncbi:hypothetical protein [Arthrobacter oryzae]|uniref:hypothetical protein n=1 Tax=Arthrobacter oryzae TaxID=409290 RepID=UPI0027D78A1B|nr:hypothetical protein [Arthrobacter oryzae]